MVTRLRLWLHTGNIVVAMVTQNQYDCCYAYEHITFTMGAHKQHNCCY